MAWEERMHTIKRNGEGKLKQKLPIPATRGDGIKTDIVVFLSSHSRDHYQSKTHLLLYKLKATNYWKFKKLLWQSDDSFVKTKLLKLGSTLQRNVVN